MPHVIGDIFPTFVYLTVEENDRLRDLRTILNNFVEQEAARFITGARPLSEFDAYINQLNAIGFREYEQIFVRYWANNQETIRRMQRN